MNRLILMSAMVLAAGACTDDEPGALPEHDAQAASVTVSDVSHAPAVESFPATVAAVQEATVATRMSGRIRSVSAEVGALVQAGQLLVELDDTDIQARLESARAQAELAERSFRRVDNLAADGAASAQELDEARARVESARAQVRDAEAQLSYVAVRAPFQGHVTARLAEPGDLANPGQPLLRVVGRGALKVVADLPSSWAGRLVPGEAVQVEIPAAGRVEDARIVRVVPALEAESRRFRVEAVFETAPPAGTGVVPGSYARLALSSGASQGSRWIPADAVVRRGQLAGVFSLEEGPDGAEVRLRWLRLGQVRAGAVEVLAGPSGALTVVRDPAATLRDGQPVGEVTRAAWEVGP